MTGEEEYETFPIIKQEYDTFVQGTEEHEAVTMCKEHEILTVKQEYDTFPTVKQEHETIPTTTEEHQTYPRILLYASCSEGRETIPGDVEVYKKHKHTQTDSPRDTPTPKPTRTIAVQCALGLAMKPAVRDFKVQCYRKLKTKTKSVGVQCAMRDSPCHITEAVSKPKTSSIAIQCGIAIGLPAPGRQMLVLTKPQVEPTTSIIGEKSAQVKVVVEVSTNDVLKSVCSSVKKYSDLQCSILDSHVEVTRKGWHDLPAIGFTPVKLCFYLSGKAWLLPLFNSPEETCFVKSEVVQFDVVHELLEKLTRQSGYLFCNGIDSALLAIAKDSPKVECINYPCKRIQSKECSGYFKTTTCIPYTNRCRGTGLCVNCSRHQSYLKRKLKIEESVSPERKLQRTAADSNYPISQLSPKSLRKRMANISRKTKH